LGVTGMQLAVTGSQLPVLHWSAVQVFWLWVCTQLPASQPAVVQLLLSVSVQGVLSVTLPCVCTQMPCSALAGSVSQPSALQSPGVGSVHGVLGVTGTQAPVAGSHVPVLHWSVVQVCCMCVCTHAPASQPAVVQLLLSVSGQGELSVTLPCVCTQ